MVPSLRGAAPPAFSRMSRGSPPSEGTEYTPRGLSKKREKTIFEPSGVHARSLAYPASFWLVRIVQLLPSALITPTCAMWSTNVRKAINWPSGEMRGPYVVEGPSRRVPLHTPSTGFRDDCQKI